MSDRPDSSASWTDGRHPDAAIEEWVFTAWTDDGRLGLISGHRLLATTSWYWAALAREGRELLHITDFEVPVRADPFILKGEAMWAEHFRDAPMEQWSIGNETYASSMDDPADALGKAYGTPTPIAFDLEWYAVEAPNEVELCGADDGYVQRGVVHGAVEILGEPTVELAEIPARRWHRWARSADRERFGPIAVDEARAHTGVRAPFAFPDGAVLDLVLASTGWRVRPTS